MIKTTRGAVETCLMAESKIADDDGVIVMDCDLEFRSKEFLHILEQILSLPIEQAVGDDGYVIRTAEKEVISNHALCGAYFFSSGKRFKQIAHQLLNEPEFKKPEYYVSLLYNYLLADGEKVKLADMEEYYSYGTPEELKRYL